MQRSLTFLIFGLVLVVGWSSFAAAPATRLTRDDVEASNNLDVESRFTAKGLAEFDVTVRLKRTPDLSTRITGRLEVFEEGQLVVSSEFKNAQPAEPSKEDRRQGVKELPLEFTFELADPYLDESKFYLTYIHPKTSRTSTYVLHLTDFIGAL